MLTMRPASSVRPAILWLGDPACHDRAVVGGKAANLSRLAALHRVPPGFCLTADASGTVRDDELGPEERASVGEAYRRLAEHCGETEPRVAVRSSALDEDGALASFAGQHETYLNITGEDAVVEAIGRCLASARSPRALAYRRQQGLPDDDVRVAVLVQQLVAADTSAVVFSANPVTGDREEVLVTASWGLGESIVGGTVTPDTYRVCKADLAIVGRQLGDKQRMTVAVPGGTREVPVPRLLRAHPALDDAQVGELARLALDLELVFVHPVDVEAAFAGGDLYLLQCRPVTTLGEARLAAD